LTFPAYLAIDSLSEARFHGVLPRVVIIPILVLLPFYLWSAATTDRVALGFAGSRRAFLREFLGWLAIGTLLAAPLQLTFLALDIRVVTSVADRSLLDVLLYALSALIASVFVGLAEEAYFRGALLGSLRTVAPWLAVLVVGALYAAAHFLGGPIPSGELGWSSGFASIRHSVIHLDSFLALLGAGLLLGALRLHFGRIAPGAGIHAGFVLCTKFAQEFTDLNPSSELAFLAGSLAGSMGYLGLLWIGVLGGGWLISSRIRSSMTHRNAPSRRN
jgi:membrane protease YdiL (CAAX protease family)